MDAEQKVRALAEAQHGVVSLEQLRTKLVLPGNVIRSLRDTGALERVHRKVYRLPTVPSSWEQRAQAVSLLAGEKCALSHRAAGVIYGLEGVPRVDEIELTVPENRNLGSLERVTIHVSSKAVPSRIVNGFRVTTLARTLVDLAAVLSPAELERALDHAHRRCESLGWLTSYLKQSNQPRRKGMGTLKTLIDEQRRGFTESPSEADFVRSLREAGFSGYTKQYVVKDTEGYVMRVDIAFVDQLVAVHIDSRFHLTMAQQKKDAEQRARLTALGWRQIVMTKAMLSEGKWVGRLVAALTAAVPGAQNGEGVRAVTRSSSPSTSRPRRST